MKIEQAQVKVINKGEILIQFFYIVPEDAKRRGEV